MAVINSTGNVGIGTLSPSNKLDVNGNAGKPGGGSWMATSDARLKSDVHDYNDGLHTILAIRPVTYKYTSASGYDTSTTHIGVIAQELQQVAPYMVSTSSIDTADKSASYLQVDNSAMVYMLINGMKEQQKIIEDLTARIGVLESGR
jgi:hypothetical protein